MLLQFVDELIERRLNVWTMRCEKVTPVDPSFEKLAILDKVRKNYQFIAGREKTFVVVDGDDAPEVVEERIWKVLDLSAFEPGP